jgi:hypothetical protein
VLLVAVDEAGRRGERAGAHDDLVVARRRLRGVERELEIGVVPGGIRRTGGRRRHAVRRGAGGSRHGAAEAEEGGDRGRRRDRGGALEEHAVTLAEALGGRTTGAPL